MFRQVMKDGESAMETGGSQYKKMLKNCTRTSELPACNESRDIRDTGVKAEPFTNSARKNVTKESNEKRMMPVPGNRHDSNLSSDTTIPGENNVTGLYEPPWTSSAQKVADNIVKKSDSTRGKLTVPKEKVFNS